MKNLKKIEKKIEEEKKYEKDVKENKKIDEMYKKKIILGKVLGEVSVEVLGKVSKEDLIL